MKKIIRKIKNFIFKIIYILIIIYLLIFVPKIFGYTPLVVVSGSMQPTLKVGSIMYYHEKEIPEFEENEILVYKIPKHIVSHRIVKKTETGFVTKGDANVSVDFNEVRVSQVLGEGTEWCIPWLGYYADYIYNHKYLMWISIIVIVIDLCNDMYNTHKKKVEVLTNNENTEISQIEEME